MSKDMRSFRNPGAAMVADALADEGSDPSEVVSMPVPPTAPAVDKIAALEAQVQALVAKLAQPQVAQPLIVKTEASVRFPQNPDYNEKSCFTHPEGEAVHPKVRLTRDTFYLGARQRDDDLTPQEILLFNAFTKGTKEARNGMWTARVTRDGSKEVLSVMCVEANSIDGRQSLPSMVLILTELHDGAQAADPSQMLVEVAMLKAQVQSLMAARA